MKNSRVLAAKLSQNVIDHGRSLDEVLSDKLANVEPQDKAFIQEMVYGICRSHGLLELVANQVLGKPLKAKDRDIHFLLLVGVYQLLFLETAPHAAISETVNGAKIVKKPWASKLLNACLRRCQREPEIFATVLKQSDLERAEITHPEWLIASIKCDWPEHWQKIVVENNARADMCLRVNPRMTSRQHFLELLQANDLIAEPDPYTSQGVILHQAVPVNAIPQFDQGIASVQDTAAQLAVELMRPQANTQILDACAAPGGKLMHILELVNNNAHVDALDVSATRLEKIKQNCARLNLTTRLFVCDARNVNGWPHPSGGYDQILIDAPCSGTGVIRRHPDIRHHRRPTDIDALVQLQSEILDALWALLKPGGSLMYTTCSVIAAENHKNMLSFAARHADAVEQPLAHPNALKVSMGYQTLPGVHAMDGFYYCSLIKR